MVMVVGIGVINGVISESEDDYIQKVENADEGDGGREDNDGSGYSIVEEVIDVVHRHHTLAVLYSYR